MMMVIPTIGGKSKSKRETFPLGTTCTEIAPHRRFLPGSDCTDPSLFDPYKSDETIAAIAALEKNNTAYREYMEAPVLARSEETL